MKKQTLKISGHLPPEEAMNPEAIFSGDRVSRHFEQALEHHRNAKFAAAEQQYRNVLKLDGTNTGALHNLGVLLLQQGKAIEAEQLLRAAIRHDPKLPHAYFHLGTTLQCLNRDEEAISYFSTALEIEPGVADGLASLANSLQKLRRFGAAIDLYCKALALQPDKPEIHYNLANALKAVNRNVEASNHYHRAIELRPNFFQAHHNLGNLLAAANRSDEAIICYRTTISLNPDLAQAHNSLGEELKATGHFEEARASFKKAIELVPNNALFQRNYAELNRFKQGDDDVASLERLGSEMQNTSWREQVDFYFAFSKALADVGEPRRSFEQILKGNSVKRQNIAYDERATLNYFDRIKSIFTSSLLQSRAHDGDPSEMPIFIVGMPRSGSTLIEQILASHPRVFGGGETTKYREAVDRAFITEHSPPRFPDGVPSMSSDRLRRVGSNYVASSVASLSATGDYLRYTDKLPDNFLLIGLIHMTLPNAKIIHSQRNPVDTCFSYFTQLFLGDKPYTNDLGELGRYYRQYVSLMEHWHQVLPPGVLLDIEYEEVVEDLEGQARRMVAHCGLNWSDTCLRFFENRRVVRSASAKQVRQPIYRSSVRRWSQYREMLGPLLKELGSV